MFGTTPIPCPKDCKRRVVGCHNAKTCKEWAEHERRQKDRKEAAIRRGMGHRMHWEARKAAEKR